MKKLLVAAAVCMSAGTYTFAQTNDSIPAQCQEVTVAVAVQDSYKEVKPEELSEQVQTTVNGYAEGYNVAKLEYNESGNLTRVTLEDKGTKAEKIIILDSEGKESK